MLKIAFTVDINSWVYNYYLNVYKLIECSYIELAEYDKIKCVRYL